MTSRLKLIAAAAVLLLVSCAPTTAGTGANVPLLVTDGGLTVKRGTSLYVRINYVPTDFAMKPTDLRASLWVPSGYASDIGDVGAQFALVDTRIAEGWGLRLDLMRAERRSVRGSGAFDDPKTEYTLFAVFRVDAPAGAVPGPYRMRGSLTARGYGSQDVAFTVEVTP